MLTEYLHYYNSRRPHQSLDQQSPIERPQPKTKGLIQKRRILGGIINDYFRPPASAPLIQPAQKSKKKPSIHLQSQIKGAFQLGLISLFPPEITPLT